MSKHSKIGIKGEQIAADFLLKKGYVILERNWRVGKKEIDIIAIDNGVVVIVEVKTRTGAAFAFPEEAVTKRKQDHLKSAATSFADMFPQYANIRFDIISIILQSGQFPQVMHFEEAFY